MNKKLINRLFIITNCILLLLGIIFLYLSIVNETTNNIYLCIALGSILLANLFNIIRIKLSRKNNK